jgi:hypothetical protein
VELLGETMAHSHSHSTFNTTSHAASCFLTLTLTLTLCRNSFTDEFFIRHKSCCSDFKTLTRHLCTSITHAKSVGFLTFISLHHSTLILQPE